MRFYVERDCVDFSGRYFKGGTEVELDAGRHSKYLRPLDAEECTAEEAAQAAAEAGDTAADAAADKEHCDEAVAEVVAAAPKKKSTRKKAEG
jgi:hypothetical protein